ncbi:hypothetical protein GGI24_003165 [Coemansia furcata]|nr:hypothetical protein GGI24_003165 [Coemansia furcata]
MDSATRGHRLAGCEHNKECLRALIARVEATKQAVQDHLDRTTGSDRSSDDTADAFVKSLTTTRLDEIVQDVISKRSTWAELREQYPPDQSCLAPLIITLGANEAVAGSEVTDLDVILMVDSVYRQAAAMAAYGYEILNFSLDGAQVNRRRVKQASDIFAKLCATLTDTRDRHIDLVTRKIAEKVNAYRREQSVSSESESESVLESGRIVPVEPTIQHVGPIARRRRKRVNRLGVSERNHPYCRRRSHLDDSAQQLPDRGATQAVGSTTVASPHTLLPSSDDSQESGRCVIDEPIVATLTTISNPDGTHVIDRPSVTDIPATFAASSRESGYMLPEVRCRRSIIRDGLLRQGYPESDITAHFNQFSEKTNCDRDNMWKSWAMWCVEKGIDPRKTSGMALETYISEKRWKETWSSQISGQIKIVWSIVEGHPPPRRHIRRII